MKEVKDNSKAVSELSPFFNPRGVALVGARSSPGFGYGIPLVLKQRGWGDRLRLVNPKGGELHGLPVYKSVFEAPDPIDLAISIVPAEKTPQVLEDLGRRGIKHVILESAGFAETDEAGKQLQERCKAIAKKRGLRVIGPNCVGVVNTENRFSAVEVLEEALTPGNLSIIAQSGVFGNVLLDSLQEQGLYIAKAATLGNRLDVDECDLLEFFKEDPQTKAVMMYLEGAADGRRLVRTLSEVTAHKPVLILKSGRTPAGKAATASHTGSMSGEDELYQAAFSQGGAIRAESLDELIALARVFTTQPLPKGPRLGVVTSSGSLAALAVDIATREGLQVPRPSSRIVEKIRPQAPKWMNVKNPLDVGPSNMFGPALAAMMEDPDIDMVLAVAIIPFAIYKQWKPLGMEPSLWFGEVEKIRKRAEDKPLVFCATGASEFMEDMKKLCGPGTPVFFSPEPAAKALAMLWRYARTRGA